MSSPRWRGRFSATARAVMAWGPVGPNAKAVRGRGRLSGVGKLELRQRHQACGLARLSLSRRRGGRHAAAWSRRQAGRTHHADPEGQRRGSTTSGAWSASRAPAATITRSTTCSCPNAYTFTRESAADRRETGPLYRFTTFHLYGTGFAAIGLGLARGALDAFVALAATKVPKTKTFVLRDNAVIQSQVALAEAKLASSRSYLLQTLHETWETAERGEALVAAAACRAQARRHLRGASGEGRRSTPSITPPAPPRSSRAIRSSGASATCTP